MKLRRIWTAGLLGMALATTSLTPAVSQTLTIMKGTANEPLNVPMNRAIVLESDTPFAELSVDVTALPKGLYFVNVATPTGSWIVKVVLN